MIDCVYLKKQKVPGMEWDWSYCELETWSADFDIWTDCPVFCELKD